MVCTSDEELADILLQIRSHGWPKDLAPDKEATLARKHDVIDFNRRFTFYYPGFNVRSTDLNARLGLAQLRKADGVVARRVENHRAYQARFSSERYGAQPFPVADAIHVRSFMLPNHPRLSVEDVHRIADVSLEMPA